MASLSFYLVVVGGVALATSFALLVTHIVLLASNDRALRAPTTAAVGAAAILAAWFYTGGKNPYGYAALGELSVFIFFGLIATVGTTLIQVKGFWQNDLLLVVTFAGATAIGLFSSAVLMVNNIRDIDTDRHVSKIGRAHV